MYCNILGMNVPFESACSTALKSLPLPDFSNTLFVFSKSSWSVSSLVHSFSSAFDFSKIKLFFIFSSFDSSGSEVLMLFGNS